jgi:hypothetical protein
LTDVEFGLERKVLRVYDGCVDLRGRLRNSEPFFDVQVPGSVAPLAGDPVTQRLKGAGDVGHTRWISVVTGHAPVGESPAEAEVIFLVARTEVPHPSLGVPRQWQLQIELVLDRDIDAGDRSTPDDPHHFPSQAVRLGSVRTEPEFFLIVLVPSLEGPVVEIRPFVMQYRAWELGSDLVLGKRLHRTRHPVVPILCVLLLMA